MTDDPSAVIVALSGGVDSSLAAALLKEQGWRVRGLHFLMPACPSKVEARKASVLRVSESLRIPVDFLDLESEFTGQVMNPFTEAYVKGLTPNPCVICNQDIKFNYLVNHADQHGIGHIATGHYAKVKRKEGCATELWRGKDREKEQSYFLHRLNQSHLRRAVFPLGDMTKRESRELARDQGLPTKEEPESQEICFIPENDYRAFMEKRIGLSISEKGDILNSQGEKLGEHCGVYRYTIGQRHGLGIASSRPYYVMELRPEENTIVVGRKEELFSTAAEAAAFHWIKGKPPEQGVEVLAQIRYRHQPAPGRLEILSPERVKFRFHDPQWAITPGQALVCYEGDRVLGGGWILKG